MFITGGAVWAKSGGLRSQQLLGSSQAALKFRDLQTCWDNMSYAYLWCMIQSKSTTCVASGQDKLQQNRPDQRPERGSHVYFPLGGQEIPPPSQHRSISRSLDLRSWMPQQLLRPNRVTFAPQATKNDMWHEPTGGYKFLRKADVLQRSWTRLKWPLSDPSSFLNMHTLNIN